MIAVHSTVHPNTCRELAKKAGAQGVSVFDAPVSGGGVAASKRRLLVMVGGEAAVVERCRPVFETFADPIVHLGELGSGQTAKLLNNLLFTANLATAATALSLANDLGVCPGPAHRSRLPQQREQLRAQRHWRHRGLDRIAGLAGALLRKDVRLVVDLADSPAARGGAELDTADAALTLMDHPR